MGSGSGGQVQHLIDYRIRCFSNFLRLLLSSPSLRQDHVLHLFLTEPHSVTWKEEATRYTAPLIVPLSGTKLSKALGTPYTSALTVLQQLEEAAGTLISSQRGIVRRSQYVKAALESLGTEYNGFSLEYAPCASTLDAIGGVHDGNATAYADIVLRRELLEEAVKEIQAHVGAVKTAIKNYASLAQEFHLLSERINVLRSEVLQTATRKSSAEAELPGLETKQREMALTMNRVKEDFWEELAVWLNRLRINWTHLLRGLASAEQLFAEQGAAAWKEVTVQASADQE